MEDFIIFFYNYYFKIIIYVIIINMVLSWLWGYFNHIKDQKEKDLQILRLSAKIQNLEAIIDNIKFVLKDKDEDEDL